MSDDLKAAQRELTDQVMGRPGVTGTAIAESDGRPCLKVFVTDEAAGKKIPGRVRGVRVVVEKTGPFEPR